MKGVIIAAGKGTRLYPTTKLSSKELLIVYDKPMIYYPLETLVNVGIKKILFVLNSNNIGYFASFLKSGADLGVEITYKVQDEQKGIADAVKLAEDFVGDDNFVLILGDNYFEDDIIEHINSFTGGAKVFLKEVIDPERFGVANIKDNKIISIVEKPKKPESNLAVTGCYVYDNKIFDIIRTLKPSARGELEITDVNSVYLSKGELFYYCLKGQWVDMGTPETILKVALLEKEKNKTSGGNIFKVT